MRRSDRIGLAAHALRCVVGVRRFVILSGIALTLAAWPSFARGDDPRDVGEGEGASAAPAAPAPTTQSVRPAPPSSAPAPSGFEDLPVGAQGAATIGLIGLLMSTVTLSGFEDPGEGVAIFGGISAGVALIGFGVAGIIVLAADEDPPPAAASSPRVPRVSLGLGGAF